MMVSRCSVTSTIVVTITLHHFLLTVLCFHRVLVTGLFVPFTPQIVVGVVTSVLGVLLHLFLIVVEVVGAHCPTHPCYHHSTLCFSLSCALTCRDSRASHSVRCNTHAHSWTGDMYPDYY